jgi:hypothetical protein
MPLLVLSFLLSRWLFAMRAATGTHVMINMTRVISWLAFVTSVDDITRILWT